MPIQSKTLHVSPACLEQVAADVAARAPEEGCGLLLGRPGQALRALPLANRWAGTARARQAFELEPGELLRHVTAREPVVGVYHSHVEGAPIPSPEDRAQLLDASGAPLWPGVCHLIVSVRSGRAVVARCYTPDLTAWDDVRLR